MDFSMLVEAEEEPDEPLVDATIFGGPETQMGFSLITDENDYGNDPLELPTPTTSPKKNLTPAPGMEIELLDTNKDTDLIEVIEVKQKGQSHRSQPQPRPRPVQIVRSMSTRRSQPPCPFTSKAHFRAEMDKNVRDAIGESIILLKTDPRQYHPFYLRIFKYVTLGQVHGFIERSVEDKWKIWGQYDNDAKEHFERWKSKSSSVSVKIPFSGEISPYASFVLRGTATVNGKEVRDDPTKKEEKELRFRDLEETAKRICEETGKDVDLRDDLSTRLKFFQYCQTVTFPGDCARMNEIWSKLLNGFGKSTPSKSVTEPNAGECQDVSNPYLDDDQEDWIPADNDPLDQKPPLITLPSSPPSPPTSSSKTQAVRTNGSEPGISKSPSKTKRNTKKVDVIKKSRSNLMNPETKRKSSAIVKKSKSSTSNGKPNSTKKTITSKSNQAKVSRGLLLEYQWRLTEEERRKQNLLKRTQAQLTSSTKLKKFRLERIKQSLSEKLAANMKSKRQELKPKATKLTSASTGEATPTSTSSKSKSRSNPDNGKPSRSTKQQREKWNARYGEKSGCPVCGKMFIQSEALWQHYKFQHLLRPDLNNQIQVKPKLSGKGGHICEICGYIFNGEPQNLVRHMRNIHGIGESGPEECLQCPHCGKTYKSKDSLNMHIRQIHQGEDYRCDICNRNCQSAGKLWRHKTEDHNMTDLPLPPGRTVSYCEICGEKTLRSLIVHVQKKHPERVAEFQETERKKRQKWKSKTPMSPTRYEQCLNKAKWRKRRNREMIRQLGSEEAIRRGLAPQYMRRRTCHMCNKEFSPSNYARHLRLKHDIEYVPIKRQADGEVPGDREIHFQQQQQNSDVKSLPTLTWELNELIEKRKLAKILFVHVTKISNGKVFICSFCPDVKSTILDEIRKHLISVHPETLALEEPLSYPQVRSPQPPQVPPPTTPVVINTKCPHCSENFPSEDDLLQHAEVAHPNFCLRCPECSKLLISPEAMTLHFAQVHVDNKGDEEEKVGNGDVKVDLDLGQGREGVVAYFKIEYVHKRTISLPDSADTAPVCKRCVPTVDFRTMAELFQHVKDSHPKNFFPCGVPNCGVTKFSLRGLKQHSLDFHRGIQKLECDPRLGSVKQYKDMRGYCPICGLNTRVSSLDKHIRLSHRTGTNSELSKKDKEILKNRLQCQSCFRRFYNGYHLLTHMEEDHEHQVDLKRIVNEVLGLFHAADTGRPRPGPKKKPKETKYSPNLRRSGRAKRKRKRIGSDDEDDEVEMDWEEDEEARKGKKRVTTRGQKRQQSEKRAGRREMPATKPCFVKVERLSEEVLARYRGDFSDTS